MKGLILDTGVKEELVPSTITIIDKNISIIKFYILIKVHFENKQWVGLVIKLFFYRKSVKIRELL